MTFLRGRRGQASHDDQIPARLDGLEQAVAAARGRLDPTLVDEAEQVLARAKARMRLSPTHTIVALAGATGSGKSSLFNLLCGLDLAAVGVKRPTTSWALACTWGEGAEELLAWLGVPPRHQVNRASSLDTSTPQQNLQGLVLLDLPDHDSTEVSHHLEVERLVGLADVLVWVLDPQKYADAAIHERFLRPLAGHRDVMLAVFNRVDELSPEAASDTVADARRLLAADGLGDIPMIATSAKRGDGVPELRDEIAKRVEQKRSARVRVAADLDSVVARLSSLTGAADPEGLAGATRKELLASCADAAAVPAVVEAVEESLRRRSRQATGWPPTRWLNGLRADPLRRLALGSGKGSRDSAPGFASRSSLPPPTPVQRARVASAVRRAADQVDASLPPAWEASTRAATLARVGDVTDSLDRALSRTDVQSGASPAWWSMVRVLQWVLLSALVVGVVWLAAAVAIDSIDVPSWLSVPVPIWLACGGLVVGLGVAALCRVLGAVTAQRRGRQAERNLREAVASVVDELVGAPIQAELDAYRSCRDGLIVASGAGRN
jgi:GTP-binding protein EngB required for normal cell division